MKLGMKGGEKEKGSKVEQKPERKVEGKLERKKGSTKLTIVDGSKEKREDKLRNFKAKLSAGPDI
jgi:hypothetical protein